MTASATGNNINVVAFETTLTDASRHREPEHNPSAAHSTKKIDHITHTMGTATFHGLRRKTRPSAGELAGSRKPSHLGWR